MALPAPPQAAKKLDSEQIIWFASVRPEGHRPHLVPVWFAWHAGRIYLCIDPSSVKARNLEVHPRVTLALQDGISPVICEGLAAAVHGDWAEDVCAIFHRKYQWDIRSDGQYSLLVEVAPDKWLAW